MTYKTETAPLASWLQLTWRTYAVIYKPETFHTMNQTKQEEEYGYDLFPERNPGGLKKTSVAKSLFTFNHKCQVMLQFAMETSEFQR